MLKTIFTADLFNHRYSLSATKLPITKLYLHTKYIANFFSFFNITITWLNAPHLILINHFSFLSGKSAVYFMFITFFNHQYHTSPVVKSRKQHCKESVVFSVGK